MKKLLVSLLVLFPLATFAGEGQGEPATGYVGHMASRLNLTEEQTHQMREILRSHRQQMRALREETEKKVNALLTKEQRTAMQELKDERQEKRKAQREHKHDQHRAGRHEGHDSDQEQPAHRNAGQAESMNGKTNGS